MTAVLWSLLFAEAVLLLDVLAQALAARWPAGEPSDGFIAQQQIRWGIDYIKAKYDQPPRQIIHITDGKVCPGPGCERCALDWALYGGVAWRVVRTDDQTPLDGQQQ